MNANTQIALNLIDHAMSMQPAVSAPRFDVSSPVMLIDSRIPEATRREIAGLGHSVTPSDQGLLFGEFASPACVGRAPDGNVGAGVDPYYYPATGIGVD
jgi:gamma-glutamyltranspeptidase